MKYTSKSLVVYMAGLLLLVGGCGNTSTPSTSTPVPTSESGPVFDWKQVVTSSVTSPSGITVKSCGGEAWIVCAYKDGKPVGKMELISYDVSKEQKTLKERIGDYYKSISIDRAQTCPKGYSINTVPPQSIQVAREEGQKAELTILAADKKPVERNTLYMMERNKTLYIFNIAGYDSGSCIASEVEYTTIHNLDEGVAEAFETVVKNSILP